MSRACYLLTLRAQPGPVQPVIRLRHLLKHALRQLGLRCPRAEQLDAGSADPRWHLQPPSQLAAELLAQAADVEALLDGADLGALAAGEACRVLIDVLGRLDTLAAFLAASGPENAQDAPGDAIASADDSRAV